MPNPRAGMCFIKQAPALLTHAARRAAQVLADRAPEGVEEVIFCHGEAYAAPRRGGSAVQQRQADFAMAGADQPDLAGGGA